MNVEFPQELTPEVFLPWHWSLQVIIQALGYGLLVLLVGYAAIATRHFVTPKRREEALELARANARSRFDYYQQDFGDDVSQAVIRSRYRKAQADMAYLDALGDRNTLALQWYQLTHINWIRVVKQEPVWALAMVGSYIMGVIWSFHA